MAVFLKPKKSLYLAAGLLLICACSDQSASPENSTAEAADSQGAAHTFVDNQTEAPQIVKQPEPVAVELSHSEDNPLESQSKGGIAVAPLCQEIGDKLSSVSLEDCTRQNFNTVGAYSSEGRPLVIKEYPPLLNKRKPLGRVLLMGGIHGDEYSSVSILFRWLKVLNEHHSGLFHWQVVPLLNPDGLLRKKSQRQNGKGIDLNRNFPTPDWDTLAKEYWLKRTYSNPRRYPGEKAASESETQWFMSLIEEFKPDAIVAVHAPHKLVDFDGPHQAPKQLGSLRLRQLGIYPGSLGNYGGVHLGIPVVTVELASAGIMPPQAEIESMWGDLIAWLRTEVPKQKLASREDAAAKL